jgi:hypothetical protein
MIHQTWPRDADGMATTLQIQPRGFGDNLGFLFTSLSVTRLQRLLPESGCAA